MKRREFLRNSMYASMAAGVSLPLSANVGEPVFSDLFYDRDGWGGRLIEQLPGQPNNVELAHEISIFGNGTTAGERLKQVIHAQNMREIALPNYDGGNLQSRRNILMRAWTVARCRDRCSD